MKYNIIITDKANREISKIFLYLIDTFDKKTAKKALDEIENSINIIKDNPEIGIIPKDNIMRKKDYRILITKKNIIFYKIQKANKEIIIHGVYNQRQDYINIISGI